MFCILIVSFIWWQFIYVVLEVCFSWRVDFFLCSIFCDDITKTGSVAPFSLFFNKVLSRLISLKFIKMSIWLLYMLLRHVHMEIWKLNMKIVQLRFLKWFLFFPFLKSVLDVPNSFHDAQSISLWVTEAYMWCVARFGTICTI